MDNETIEEYAKYRLEKAKETLHTAELILNDIIECDIRITDEFDVKKAFELIEKKYNL